VVLITARPPLDRHAGLLVLGDHASQ
jgi:hypothetical protein